MAGTGKAHLRDGDTVLTVEDLVVEFKVGRGNTVKAVSGISFDVLRGETLGIVGESGCGKSTTGRAIMQIPSPNEGSIVFEGQDLTTLKKNEVREARTRVQMIFQDPVSSLNPRRSVRDSVLEPLEIWGRGTKAERERLVDETLEAVGIDPERAAESRPHQFSGGQCQRISIARALVLDPKVIICDEPVSALDVSVQAQILNLLEDMKERYGVSLMFISHDLSVVKNISDRVMVMYMGKTCEVAQSDDLFAKPTHHYTRALMAAIPGAEVDVEEQMLEGELPSAIDPPAGCRFNTRCPAATDECRSVEPEIREVAVGHYVACHHPVLDAEPAGV